MSRIRAFAFGAVMTLLTCQTHGQQVDYVLHISVDGLHAGQLQSLISTVPDEFASFRRFVTEGATTFNARTDYFNPYTIPNHTTMITGRPVLQPGDDPTLHHGYTSNSTPPLDTTIHSRNPAVNYVASTFDIAHDYGKSTAIYATKRKFVLYEQTYNETLMTPGGRPDNYLENGDQGINKIDQYVFDVEDGTSSGIIMRMREDFETEPFNYAFIHLYELDSVGHRYGWRTDVWNDTVTLIDDHLYDIFDMIENHPALVDRTAVILSADHGGTLFNHNDTQDPNVITIPFFVWGPNIPAGYDLYDLNQLTRTDPEQQVIDYLADEQPIRNGDGANLAMSLLGLPPIDGSSINARQDLRVELPVLATWTGNDPQAGLPGDGSHWDDARNWTRGSVVDRKPIAGDLLDLPGNDALQSIDFEFPQPVHAIQVAGDYQLNGGLQIVTGAIDIAAGRTLSVEDELTTKRSIIKSGGGNLVIGANTASDFVTNELLIPADSGRVAGHDVIVNGSLANRSTLAFSSETTGTWTITTDYQQLWTGTLEMRVGAAETSDLLVAGRNAVFAGNLSIESLDDTVLPDDFGIVNWWRISHADHLHGRFSSFEFDGQSQFWFNDTPSSQITHLGAGRFARLEYGSHDLDLAIYRTVPGDVNGDGAFLTDDLVSVFIAGGYENGVENDANWLIGDWDGDADFTSDDLVTAFIAGAYEQPSILLRTAAVPEPASGLITLMAMLCLVQFGRRQTR